MSLTLVSPPQQLPITVNDLRMQLRIDDAIENTLLRSLCAAVTQRAEHATRRALITQTWDCYLDEWPAWHGYHGGSRIEPVTVVLPAGGFVWLPKAPLQSVSFVKYTDFSGTVNTWATTEYLVDAPSGDYAARGRLSLAWQKVWPIVRTTANAIQIRMVCGYGDSPDDVPELLRQAMLMDAVTLYENRAAILTGLRAAAIEIPSTTRDIYRSFRSL